MDKIALLRQLSFGQRVAEEEREALDQYFVETDQWRRLYADEIDVVYGPKGSGKSALYSLLIARTDELFDRQIVLAPAENPRGAPAFKDLVTDPPASELEFVSLWKLYFACLISGAFDDIGIAGSEATAVHDALKREGLVRGERTLQSLGPGARQTPVKTAVGAGGEGTFSGRSPSARNCRTADSGTAFLRPPPPTGP